VRPGHLAIFPLYRLSEAKPLPTGLGEGLAGVSAGEMALTLQRTRPRPARPCKRSASRSGTRHPDAVYRPELSFLVAGFLARNRNFLALDNKIACIRLAKASQPWSLHEPKRFTLLAISSVARRSLRRGCLGTRRALTQDT
jgi:hypothetical protein